MRTEVCTMDYFYCGASTAHTCMSTCPRTVTASSHFLKAMCGRHVIFCSTGEFFPGSAENCLTGSLPQVYVL